jgi:TPR repeat protein
MHIKRFLLGALIISLIAAPVEATSSEKDPTMRDIQHLAEKGDLLAKDASSARDDSRHAVTKEMKSAAEQGNAKAQVELAHRYLKGDGVERDLAQAFYWYRQAAAQGDADAQYNLAIMYEYGWGVEKDIAQAVEWYRKAMDQGHEGAFRALEIHFTPE